MSAGHSAALRRHEGPPQAPAGRAESVLTVAKHSPVPRGGYVGRPALVRSLAEARDTAIALVIAPPGYGKSTLLVDWAQYEERPFIWLAPGDEGRGRLRLLDGTNASGRGSDHGDASRVGRDSFAELVRRTCGEHESFVLVVDDADALPPRVLRDAVQTALDELPQGSMIALTSRSEPPLPIGRLRAHGLLIEIRMQQLAMTPAEGAALLAQAGVGPELEVVQMLVSRTEGWPAALSLAALALRDSPDGAADFAGPHHMVSDYLRDEVFAALPAEAETFALRTSIF